MARPFYSAPGKLPPAFPPLPGQVVPPPPHVLTGPRPPAPPPGFHSDKPWMTPQLVAEIRRRNQVQARAARSGAEADRAAAEHHRQLVNRLVGDAKERFCLAHPERTDEILSSDRRARPFHCGSCDRSYGSQQQLDEHCREHVRCGLEGCPFTAHPRVVEKHVTMQHQTGLAKVIMSLNTPEAVARWREQRRANFCRPESAARRQQERAATERPPRPQHQQPPKKRRKRLTLLEKLLAPDIERERNIILQCVRHIIHENFFDGRSADRPARCHLGRSGGQRSEPGSDDRCGPRGVSGAAAGGGGGAGRMRRACGGGC
ncbi:nuclear fragile X mental retardation-interacting protein 1-like [Pollicipes pollicipes]|uniref:nuclear fragile X mental retardation-interacting protein 1-like n=1 Tax=Pollicipes pollicipes TaxID=41117 RepID=UPI001884AE9C|nr:nuclear fragile X mental retardation-interacting protein 1-like [Pollicipes pollicipes]